jgi:hypothetical protein
MAVVSGSLLNKFEDLEMCTGGDCSQTYGTTFYLTIFITHFNIFAHLYWFDDDCS